MIKGAYMTFVKATGDLEGMDEFWSLKTFNQCKTEIEEHNLRATKHLPSKNMFYIRSCTLTIAEDTTMQQLVNMTTAIIETYHIHCFQIAIDRQGRTASFLFDFYDRDKCEIVYLNLCKLNYMYVFIQYKLGLPIPSTPSLLRRYLVAAYMDDRNQYRRLLISIRKAGLGKRDFNLIRSCLMYIEKNLEGITK